MKSQYRKFLIYAAYTAAIIVFFLYHLFPADAVKNYIIHQFHQTRPNYTLDIEHLSPAFPLGLTGKNVHIFQGETSLVEADKVKITPNLLSLAGSNPEIFLRGAVWDGKFDGNLVLKKSNGKFISEKTEMDFSDVQIRYPLQSLFTQNITGLLKGRIIYDISEKSAKGSANLILSNVVVTSEKPLFPVLKKLKSLSFTDIQAQMSLNLNDQLKIESFTLNGSEAEASITGNIVLKKPSDKTRLKLEGSLTPRPALLSQMGMMAALLKNKKKLNFEISGTIAKPGFSLK